MVDLDFILFYYVLLCQKNQKIGETGVEDGQSVI